MPDDPPPSAENRLVTMEGIRPDGAPQVYVVAADTVDLTDLGPPQTRGRIGVVDNDPTRGLATLTFLGYELNPDDGHYVVKALAVNEEPALKIPGDDVHIVQFVGFASDGFKLHMSIVKPEHPVPHTEHNLGTCMIEVSKVVKRRLAD